MKRQVKWEGVYPAVTTKFTASGDLDVPTYLKNIEAQIQAGVDGIIIGGSLGESSTITHEERLELLNATLDCSNGRVDVILNIAEGSTRNAISLARKAQDLGAHGLMLLPPMMYKPTDYETADYFKTIASNTDLPIVIYNNPVDYKIEITIPMFEEFTKYDNLQAAKERLSSHHSAQRPPMARSPSCAPWRQQDGNQDQRKRRGGRASADDDYYKKGFAMCRSRSCRGMARRSRR